MVVFLRDGDELHERFVLCTKEGRGVVGISHSGLQ